MDYQQCYEEAKRKYNNACYQINACQGQKNRLNGEKQNHIKQLNEKSQQKKEISKTEKEVSTILKNEDNLNKMLNAVSEKTRNASEVFSKMVKASDIQGKNLTDTFASESKGTAATLSSILEMLRIKKQELENKSETLDHEISSLNNQIEEEKRQIKNISSDIQYWNQIKIKAFAEMESYRIKKAFQF